MPKGRQQQEQSEEYSDQQNQQEYLQAQRRKPKIERLDKIKNFKKIIINVSMTQYSVISEVAESLDWKIQTTNDAGDWDIFWIDMSIDPDILIKMHLFQKISHYPGIHIIARKNLLGLNLMSLRAKIPEQFEFFPLTWMLPLQYAEFRNYYESKPKGKARTYIVKPEAECQGRGIFLTRKIEDLQNGKHYVVQRYVARPYLIQGLKFDLRIYILLCGTNPLRLYMYNQGLARLATEKYIEPNRFNLQKQFIHLTNYAINKNNPKFVFNNNRNNMGVGHKRSVSSVFKLLAERGVNIEELKAKIHDVTIKTIICGLPLMSHQYKYSQPEDYSGSMCFHILGLDIMLNNKAEPILLEVNHTPSFTTDTPLDHHIKSSLIRDTLVLMNINVKTKVDLYNKAKDISKERLYNGKRSILEGKQRQMAIEQAQKLRDQYQDKHLGGFQRIFPIKDEQLMQKYNEIISMANKTYTQDSGSLRLKQIQKQAKQIRKSQLKQSIKTKSTKQTFQQKLRRTQDQKSAEKNGQNIFPAYKTAENNKQDNHLSINIHDQSLQEDSQINLTEMSMIKKQSEEPVFVSDLSSMKKSEMKRAMEKNNERNLKFFRDQFKSLEQKGNSVQQSSARNTPKITTNCKTYNTIEQPHSAIISVSKLYNQGQTYKERIKSNTTAKTQLKRNKEMYSQLPNISDNIFSNKCNIIKRQNHTSVTIKNPQALPQKLEKALRPQKFQIKIYDHIANSIKEMIEKKTHGQYVMPKIVNLNISKQKVRNHNTSEKKNIYFESSKNDH